MRSNKSKSKQSIYSLLGKRCLPPLYKVNDDGCLAEHTNRQRKRHMKENSTENPRRTVDEKRRRVEGREHERLQPVLRRQKLRQLELEQLKVRQNLQDQQRTLERLRRENFGALLLFAPVGLVLIYFWVCGLFERNCRSIRRCLCTCYHVDFYVSLFVYLFLFSFIFKVAFLRALRAQGWG